MAPDQQVGGAVDIGIVVKRSAEQTPDSVKEASRCALRLPNGFRLRRHLKRSWCTRCESASNRDRCEILRYLFDRSVRITTLVGSQSATIGTPLPDESASELNTLSQSMVGSRLGTERHPRQASTQAAREGAFFELGPFDRRALRSATDITCAVEAASMTRVAW